MMPAAINAARISLMRVIASSRWVEESHPPEDVPVPPAGQDAWAALARTPTGQGPPAAIVVDKVAGVVVISFCSFAIKS
jgi:hypothetical protein